jgi:hypothetical protein
MNIMSKDSSFYKTLPDQTKDPIEVSNNLLLLFSEIIADCPTCLEKLRAKGDLGK